MITSDKISFHFINTATCSDCCFLFFRYYSVVYPLERKITIFKGKIMVFYVWFHAIVICLPDIFVYQLKPTPWGHLQCEDSWDSDQQGQAYLICFTILTIFGPLLITCLAYCFVWRAFRRSQKKVHVRSILKRAKHCSYLPHTSRTEARLFKMLFLMVFCFVVLWAPYVVYRFFKYFSPLKSPVSEYFLLTATWICKLQPIMDPLIYGYLNKTFRQSFHCTCPDGFRSETTASSTNDPYSSEPSGQDEDHQQPRTPPGGAEPQLPLTGSTQTAIKSLSIRGLYFQRDLQYSVNISPHDPNSNPLNVGLPSGGRVRHSEINGIQGINNTLEKQTSVIKTEAQTVLSEKRIRLSNFFKSRRKNRIRSSSSENHENGYFMTPDNTMCPLSYQNSHITPRSTYPQTRSNVWPDVTVVTSTTPTIYTTFSRSPHSSLVEPDVLLSTSISYPGDRPMSLPRKSGGQLPPLRPKDFCTGAEHNLTDKSIKPKRKRKKILSKRIEMKRLAHTKQETTVTQLPHVSRY